MIEMVNQKDNAISRAEVVDTIKEYFDRIGKLKPNGLNKGEKAICLDLIELVKILQPLDVIPVIRKSDWVTPKKTNTKDMVQVVRCRDCKYFSSVDNRFFKTQECYRIMISDGDEDFPIDTTEDSFCSWGERKEDECHNKT